MKHQVDQIKNLLQDITRESEIVAGRYNDVLLELDEAKARCRFLSDEVIRCDAKNLDKHERVLGLKEMLSASEDRELAMLSQIIDVQVALDRLRETFVQGLRATDYCSERNSIFEKCDHCRGKAQAWNIAISFLDGMVQNTFWGDDNNG